MYLHNSFIEQVQFCNCWHLIIKMNRILKVKMRVVCWKAIVQIKSYLTVTMQPALSLMIFYIRNLLIMHQLYAKVGFNNSISTGTYIDLTA